MATKRPYLLHDEAAISTMMTVLSPDNKKKFTPSELSDMEDIRIAFSKNSVNGCDLSIPNYDQIKKKLRAVCNKLSKQNDVIMLIKTFLDATTANTNGDIILSTSVTPAQAKELNDKLNDHIFNTMYTYLFFLLGDNVYKSIDNHQTGGAQVRFYGTLDPVSRGSFIRRLERFSRDNRDPILLEFIDEVRRGTDMFEWNRYQSISGIIVEALGRAELDSGLLRGYMNAARREQLAAPPGPAQAAARGNSNEEVGSTALAKGVEDSMRNFKRRNLRFNQVVSLMKSRHAFLVANPPDGFDSNDEYERMQQFLLDLAGVHIDRATDETNECRRYIERYHIDLRRAQKLLDESRSFMSRAYNSLPDMPDMPGVLGASTTLLLSGCTIYHAYQDIMNPGLFTRIGNSVATYFVGPQAVDERIRNVIGLTALVVVGSIKVGKTITAQARHYLSQTDEEYVRNDEYQKLMNENQQLRQKINNRNLDFIRNGIRLGAAAVVLYAGQPTAAAGMMALRRHGLDRAADFAGLARIDHAAVDARAVEANPPPRQLTNPQQGNNEAVGSLFRDGPRRRRELLLAAPADMADHGFRVATRAANGPGAAAAINFRPVPRVASSAAAGPANHHAASSASQSSFGSYNPRAEAVNHDVQPGTGVLSEPGSVSSAAGPHFARVASAAASDGHDPGTVYTNRGAGASSSSGLVTPGRRPPISTGFRHVGSFTIPNSNNEKEGGRRKYSGRKTKHKKRHNKRYTKRHSKRHTRK